MPIDLATTLSLTKADLDAIEEALNGLRNIECADETPDDAATIRAAIVVYEEWLALMVPIVANFIALAARGYPIFPTFLVSMAMKGRTRKELKASTVAESLFIGTRSAVSGSLAFSPPIPKQPDK